MKLKRVLLITMAVVETLLLCISAYVIYRALERLDPTYPVGYYISLIGYINGMANAPRAIFLLAVVDFVFCLGQKRYNKSMLGIAIALFSFSIIMSVLSSTYLGLGVAFFQEAVRVDPHKAFANYLLWLGLTTAPYPGLAVAYIVVKALYLKTTAKNLQIV